MEVRDKNIVIGRGKDLLFGVSGGRGGASLGRC